MKIHMQSNSDKSFAPLRRAGVLFNGAGLLLLLISLAFILFLTLPGVLGIHVYAVVSGSMQPTIPTGSLVCAKNADPAQIAQSDIIIFKAGEASASVITHRVVENQADQSQFITKGDANHAADREPVAYSRLIGKVFATFPGLGRLALFLSTASGKLAMLVLLVLAGILMTAGDQLKKRSRL